MGKISINVFCYCFGYCFNALETSMHDNMKVTTRNSSFRRQVKPKVAVLSNEKNGEYLGFLLLPKRLDSGGCLLIFS